MTQITTLQGQTMGGPWRLRLPFVAPEAAVQRVVYAVQARFDLVEGQMSAWRADSPLSRVNAARLGKPVPVPAEMAHVLQAGLDLMQVAPGAFSVFLGGISARYGFQPGPESSAPALPRAIVLQGLHVIRHADVALDLNALAKGFAADLAGAALCTLGHQHFLIEVAGDILARGQRPDGLPWTVALELPLADKIIPARLIPVAGAIATSGGYRRARAGHSHLISPQSGTPLRADAGSVAVLAATAMQADGLATALAVMGVKAGLRFAEDHGISCTYIVPDAGGFAERGSRRMHDYLQRAA